MPWHSGMTAANQDAGLDGLREELAAARSRHAAARGILRVICASLTDAKAVFAAPNEWAPHLCHGQRVRVAADAAKNGHRDGVLAVGADQRRVVLVADHRAAHVADANRLSVDVGQHELVEVGRHVGLAVQQDLKLQRAAV